METERRCSHQRTKMKSLGDEPSHTQDAVVQKPSKIKTGTNIYATQHNCTKKKLAMRVTSWFRSILNDPKRSFHRVINLL